MEIIWNEDRMGKLETLYRDGWSCAMIGREIGVSKNAVVGKSHRMKLPRRRVITHQIKQAKGNYPTRRRSSRTAVMKKKAPPPLIDPDRNYSCSILDLNNTTCRYPVWPTGAPLAEQFYCGVPGADYSAGLPYCKHHSFICTNFRH